MSTSFVYQIINAINGKRYIGKTTQTLTERFRQHQFKSKRLNTYLYKAMRKYGLEHFTIEPIEEVTDGNLNEREQFWIDTLNTMAPNGYNLVAGGTGGDTSNTPGYKEGMAQRRTFVGDGNPNYGKYGKDSPNYGKKRTEEQKQRLSEGLKRGWTEERKAKLREQKRGAGNHMAGRTPANASRVELDGVLYDSIADCCRKTGLSAYTVNKQGKRIPSDKSQETLV